jgi:hypothetical protein
MYSIPRNLIFNVAGFNVRSFNDWPLDNFLCFFFISSELSCKAVLLTKEICEITLEFDILLKISQSLIKGEFS